MHFATSQGVAYEETFFVFVGQLDVQGRGQGQVIQVIWSLPVVSRPLFPTPFMKKALSLKRNLMLISTPGGRGLPM